MGDISQPALVLPLLAAFSRHEGALEWAREKSAQVWSCVASESEAFEFVETTYYESTMGPGLKKIFWVYDRLIDPAKLVEMKLQTNQWEEDYAAESGHDEPRPLNLDPGYISLAKLVLASTKDHAHRIYLDRGIYAEVTLSYRGKAWQAFDSTFPDYQREDFQTFFSECRTQLQRQLREERDR